MKMNSLGNDPVNCTSSSINYFMHDGYNMLRPMRTDFSTTPMLKMHFDRKIADARARSSAWHSVAVDTYSRKARNICHATFGLVSMKMLKFFEDGGEHNYREICPVLFPGKPLSHDKDCFNYLRTNGMVTLSRKGKRGVMFFKLTPLGEEVLGICYKNDVYFRPMRWFALDEDEMFSSMVEHDMSGGDSSGDITTESVLNLVKALLSADSDIAKIGSRYKFFNKFMKMLKTKQSFYEAVNQPEVNAWLDEHCCDAEVYCFYAAWKSIRRMWSKKLGAQQR